MKKVEITEAPKAVGPYSQAVNDGNYLFVSGQLPIDPTTGKLVVGDIRVHANRVLDNIEAILRSQGCGWDRVVRMEVFMKDLGEFQAMNEEYGRRLANALPPARQTIQVAKLPMDAPIEISCIAKL